MCNREYSSGRLAQPALSSWSGLILCLLAVMLLVACGDRNASQDEWQVVEVTGPSSLGEASSFAGGATVVLEQEALVLALPNARMRLSGEVTQESNGDASIKISEGRFAGREIRWEKVDEDRARLVWPGKNGTTLMGLERGTR